MSVLVTQDPIEVAFSALPKVQATQIVIEVIVQGTFTIIQPVVTTVRNFVRS